MAIARLSTTSVIGPPSTSAPRLVTTSSSVRSTPTIASNHKHSTALTAYQDGREEKGDTIAIHSHNKNIAHQVTLYAEDEMTLNERWSVNGGLNVDLFSISGKTFSTLSPRLSMKYQPSDRLSFKASYTLMSQFVHKIANSFLDLPTDYWVPTTARLHPMRAWQLAAGAYLKPTLTGC